ncbi:MAG: NAD(P)-dependent oxidoreductase [Nitrososphaerota archaeon]|nr:NAD(P)-dependent oxidoreductase [Nitrososphaerota archaeon]MDG6974949.1 NAD(P)-dependent oxidoreductase [Nitrososphaerota archaeon]MDG7009298.1 NAD(P)-dependent oxidoreductase [Nitrososphaerota archaeon]MDG7018854.1 NAD(P)-dependent oxidoreductase [Nitrososphaerota archaeon]MDG7027125.1 NAD(P)-dependent oxidoreductase [Nitrososphaerota archaeon]
MNLLVGATGFVGGHLVEYLFQQGEISKGVFRKGSHLKIMDLNGVQGIEADLTDHHALHEAMEGADVVYNLASPMPGEADGFQKTSTEGLLNLLEVASEAKAKAFVHLSTLDVYGFAAGQIGPSTPLRPSGEYQESKAEAERLLQEFAKRSVTPRVTIIRAARALGSRDESLVVPMLKMVSGGKVVVPKGGQMSYTHPRDVAKAMYGAAVGNPPGGNAYSVKSFEATPEELAGALASALGKEVQVKKEGLFAGGALPRYTSDQLKASLRIDVQPSWKDISYAPDYTLKGACEEIAAWYRKEPWVTESS